MQGYIDSHELAGGALHVFSEAETIFRGKWGLSDIEATRSVEYDSIFRLMSMTKPIVAAAVMICAERGLIDIDDPVSHYLTEFADMQVNHDPKYANGPDLLKRIPLLLPFFNISKVKTKPASRDITVRDLLSHSIRVLRSRFLKPQRKPDIVCDGSVRIILHKNTPVTL
jgi:CubicO group peptidase (beta-lactamase class C family)